MDAALAKTTDNWLFQNSLDAVFLTVPDGRILAANPAACSMLGRSEDEICRIGRSGVLDLSDPRLPAALAERERTGRLRAELTFVRADGTRFAGDITSVVFRDSEGNARTAMIVRDMSEHKRLAQEREQYFRFFMLSTDPMCIADPFGCFKRVNPAFAQLTGYSEAELVAKPFLDFVLPEDRQETADEMKLQVALRPSMRFENRYVCKDGTVVPLSWTAYFDNTDGVTYAAARDITERKKAEKALRKSKHQYDLLASRIPVGIYLLRSMPDGSFALDYASPRMAEMLNLSVERLLEDSTSVFQAIHPDDRQGFIELNQDGIQQQRPFDWTGRFPAAGTIKWLHFASTPETQDDGTILWFGLVADVTERKQMEDQVRQLAFHDALTNLPNRRLLDDRLRQAMAAIKRSGCYGAMMFLDLDNFKSLNDAHGHTVGDLLLIEAAARLKSCVRATDTVARFGGDEFVVMISELYVDESESATQARVIAEKVRAVLGEPHVLNIRRAGTTETTVEHRCTASIGMTLFGRHETNQEDVLSRADRAMYQAKAAGRNLIRFYDSKA